MERWVVLIIPVELCLYLIGYVNKLKGMCKHPFFYSSSSLIEFRISVGLLSISR